MAAAGSGDDLDWKVEVGSQVPDFSLTSADGGRVRLSDFLGSKVMVCFYHLGRSPSHLYAASKLVGNYKKLAWASQLKVLAIFRVDVACLGGSAEAVARHTLGRDCYPFVALADPEGAAALAFELERTLWRKEARFLPTEFLVDEGGIVVDVMQATRSSEALALDRVSSFLLHGTRHPSASRERRGMKFGMEVGSLALQFLRQGRSVRHSCRNLGNERSFSADDADEHSSSEPLSESPDSILLGSKAARILGRRCRRGSFNDPLSELSRRCRRASF